MKDLDKIIIEIHAKDGTWTFCTFYTIEKTLKYLEEITNNLLSEKGEQTKLNFD